MEKRGCNFYLFVGGRFCLSLIGRGGKQLKKRVIMILVLIICVCSICCMENRQVVASEAEQVIKNDETGIPDKALYQAILEMLDKEADEMFTKEEAEEIELLQARMARGGKDSVASLKGIGYLSNLRKLDLEGNSLKSLDGIEELTKLEALTVDSGLLKSLQGVENMNSLKSLSVIHNELTSLDGIQTLKGLEYLAVGENEITSLKEVKKLENLVGLWALGCNLKKLPDMQKFNHLKFSECEFTGNYLSKKELKNKLPKRFFNGSSDYKKNWVENQIDFQCQNYGVKFITPKKKMVTKDTKAIIGKSYKKARIELFDAKGKKCIKKVMANSKGEFSLNDLNLKKWAGRVLALKVSFRVGDGEYVVVNNIRFKVVL